MSDIDFDELDRAVNSLINESPKEDDNLSLPPVNDNSQPTIQAISTPAAPVTVPDIPTPIKPAAERPSTGRFMDVVYPTSNMRSNVVVPPREAKPVNAPKVDRPNLTSAPIDIFSPIKKPTIKTPVFTPAATPVAAPALIDNKPAESAPQFVPSPEKTASTNQLNNEIDDALVKAAAPLDSPFITGAKVEKRPLGAFSDDAAVESQPEVMQMKINSPDLPDELQDELLNIESKGVMLQESQPKPVQAPAPIIPVAPAVEEKPAQVQEELPKEPAKAQPAIQGSIKQQYTEKPSVVDTQTVPIYDTKNYHKPLAPTKKKSGWLWVLWIFLLIILGAGSGVAVYFLVLPNL